MNIYCTGCQKDVKARLTNGKERYPHRPDLHDLPFWKCDTCMNYVGCHHKTKTPTKPLGCIATPKLLEARNHIHALLDPLWQSKKIRRGQAYAYIGNRIGKNYHTGELRSVEEARTVYKIILQLKKELEDGK